MAVAENPLARHGVGKRFKDAQLEHLDRKFFSSVLDYARHAEQYLQEGRGLLLSGTPGCGKTYAMVALMKYLKSTMQTRFDFLFVTAPGMFEVLDRRDAVDTYRGGKPWLHTFENIPALVINDLGKENREREWLAEGVTARLGRVLRARHEEQLPIFITTNLALIAPRNQKLAPTMQNTYGESLWSLLHDMTIFREQITAPDRRITGIDE